MPRGPRSCPSLLRRRGRLGTRSGTRRYPVRSRGPTPRPGRCRRRG
ncbi:hypothetical protein ACFFX0_19410 [Citricoccus parietis]|uniref:Uncharacterized protein n=1 Tax=Citricoccus parietis TaxID=592307 RepID=A0ABV5G2T7_9MICC